MKNVFAVLGVVCFILSLSANIYLTRHAISLRNNPAEAGVAPLTKMTPTEKVAAVAKDSVKDSGKDNGKAVSKSGGATISASAPESNSSGVEASTPPIPGPVRSQNIERTSVQLIVNAKNCLTGEDGLSGATTARIELEGISPNMNITRRDIRMIPAPRKLTSVLFRGGTLTMKGRFEYGVEYTVILSRGLKLNDSGEHLKSDFPIILSWSRPSPFAMFTDCGPYYPVQVSDGGIKRCDMRIKVFNAKKIEVVLKKQAENNLDVAPLISSFTWMGNEWASNCSMLKFASKIIELSSQKDVLEEHYVDLAGVAGKLPPGLYMAEINVLASHSDKENVNGLNWWMCKGCTRKCLIALTSLGVATTIDADGRTAAVTVRDLNTLGPVAGADVRVVSLKRQTVADGKTGADGVALLNFVPEYSDEKDSPKTIIVRKDKDITLMRLDTETQLDTSETMNTGRSLKPPYQAFLYTERGIYRPGERAYLSCFVRKYDDDGMTAAAVPFELVIKDPRGNTVSKKMLKANADGFATSEVTISETALTGTYSVSCGSGDGTSWDTQHFLVGYFMPDRIKVTLRPDDALISTNDEFVVKFQASYYFGQEVTNASVRPSLSGVRYLPPHWKEYTVGSGRNDDSFDVNVFKTMPIKAYNGELKFPALDSLIISGRGFLRELDMFNTPLKVNISVGVTEPGGRTVTGNTTVTAFANPYYLGIRQKKSDGDGDSAVEHFEVKMLGPEPDIMPDIAPEDEAVSVSLVRKEWEYKLLGGENSRREWTLTEKDQGQFAPINFKSDTADYSLHGLQEGLYELRLMYGPGLVTAITFWHSEGDAGGVRSSNPSILNVKSDKESYLPGETAVVTFDSISDGACMLTVGERRIFAAYALDVKKGTNSVQVTIPPQIRTAACFTAITLLAHSDTQPRRSFAFLRLPLKQDASLLKLSLNAPAKAMPGQELELRLKASGPDGKACGATVQLFAVDEGILSVTDYKTPDIFGALHGKYFCGFEFYDIYSNLFPEQAIRRQDRAGGDGNLGGYRLKDMKLKKNAVVVLPPVTLPDAGEAVVKMKLPEHVGGMRIMAVGANKSLCGSAESALVIREKASVLPSLPVAVAPGDDFQATFTIFNHELDTDKGELSVSLPDGLTGGKDLKMIITVPKGSSKVVTMPLHAAKVGAQSVKFVLAIGGQSIKGESIVNVRSIVPPMHVSELKILKPGETSTFKTADGEWESLERCELVLSGTPAMAVRDSMEWLNAYPYGCLEQTTSAAFPMLAVDGLVSGGIIDPSFKALAEDRIHAGALALLGMMRGSIGFVSWPDSNEIWYSVSAYAAHFLVKARPNIMSEEMFKNLVKYLRKRSDYIDSCEQSALTDKAYAVYVLALAGDRSAQPRAHMVLARETVSYGFASFLAGAALYRAGFASDGVPVIKRGLNLKCWEPDNERSKSWFMNTLAVRAGMTLALAMECVPEHPAIPALALELASLLRKDGNCWGSTRDNAWASIGLAAYAERHPAAKCEVSIDSGDDKPAVLTFDKSLKTDVNPDKDCIVMNTGKGELFVRSLCVGIPRKAVPDASVMEITKEYMDADGMPVTSVKHGDLLTVRLLITPKQKLPDAVVLDLLPGGFEIEDGSLATRRKSTAPEDDDARYDKPVVARQQNLQDRFLLFGTINGTIKPQKTTCIEYAIRAVTPGTFAIPPTRIEDMYEVDRRGTFVTDAKITVTP